MELGDQRASSNVEDRRGMSIGGGLGIGGVVIAIIAAFLGLDPGQVLNTVQQVSPPQETGTPIEGVPKDEMGQFVSKVLGSTEDVWAEIFRANGKEYRPPKLVLYSGAVRSACGMGQSAMGPFYCPNDEQLYIDLSFYRDLKDRFHAPGDFAQAYVIAHEVGHHVQKLTGGFFLDRRQHFAIDAFQLLANARLLAGEAAQVIELGAAHVAFALHLDGGERRRVGLERSLHALAARDLAHDEIGVEAAVALGDHHAFVGLLALLVALDHRDLHDDRVARREFRDLAPEAGDLFLLEFRNQVHLRSFQGPAVWPFAQSRQSADARGLLFTAAAVLLAARGGIPPTTADPPARASSRRSDRACGPTCVPAPACGASARSPRGFPTTARRAPALRSTLPAACSAARRAIHPRTNPARHSRHR